MADTPDTPPPLPEPDGTVYAARYGGLDPIGDGYTTATVRRILAERDAENKRPRDSVATYMAERNQARGVVLRYRAEVASLRAERKPLTDAEIARIASAPCVVAGSYVYAFARAIERAHGIGTDAARAAGEETNA